MYIFFPCSGLNRQIFTTRKISLHIPYQGSNVKTLLMPSLKSFFSIFKYEVQHKIKSIRYSNDIFMS